jgi:hypothetical protein
MTKTILVVLAIVVCFNSILSCGDDDGGLDGGTDTDTDTDTTCTEDRTRCLINMIQKCLSNVWEDWTDCPAQGKKCALIQGEAFCVTGGNTDTDCDEGCECPDISPGVATWSCRATSYDMPTCTDFPKATWSEADAIASCQASADMGGGQIDSWGEVNCAVDNFNTTWRCIATADTHGDQPTYVAYAESMPKGICGSGAALAGVVEERPADGCWTDADTDSSCEPDCFDKECGPNGCGGTCGPGCGLDYECSDVTDQCIFIGCDGGCVCPDISPGVATWSCRATSYDMGTCTDYPKLTWSEADALTNCQASADMGGGTVDSWGEVNCAVDNFDTTWRCIATSDADGILPTYYTYAETMPKGICGSAAALTGVVDYRPADRCWTDYE